MFEKAKKYLISKGVNESDIYEFDVSSATVELAALALGCEPCRIAKSMTFESPDGCVMVVAAGDVKIDNSKFKQYFSFKAKMLSPESLVPLVGYAMGGVCPFDVNGGVKIYLDESLKRFETVFPACGSSNSAVKLEPQQLFEISGAVEWIDVCKHKE